MSGERILFIDRDGTIIEEPPDEQVDSLQKLRLLPGVIPALLELKRAGYRFVLVSNQDGLGTNSFPEPAFRETQDFIRALFSSQGIEFDAEFFCPHTPADGCECRKPRTGLLTEFLRQHVPDPSNSFVIGDRDTDMQLAALRGAVNGLMSEVMEAHLREEFGQPARSDAQRAARVAEMSSLIRSYLK